MKNIETMLEALSDPSIFEKVWNQIRNDYPVSQERLKCFATTRIDPDSKWDDSIIMDDKCYELMIIITDHQSQRLQEAYQAFCEYEKQARNKEVLAGVLLVK